MDFSELCFVPLGFVPSGFVPLSLSAKKIEYVFGYLGSKNQGYNKPTTSPDLTSNVLWSKFKRVIWGTTIGGIKEDARSLEYSSTGDFHIIKMIPNRL